MNGHFVREAVDFDSLPEGIEIVPLAEALANGHEWLAHLSPIPWASDNPVYQLNTSFMADGVMIRIAGHVETPDPSALRHRQRLLPSPPRPACSWSWRRAPP